MCPQIKINMPYTSIIHYNNIIAKLYIVNNFQKDLIKKILKIHYKKNL